MSVIVKGGASAKKGAYLWKKLTAQGGDFVDFVVSDNSTAYPDGGTQDGYWYEKMIEGIDLSSLGCTKIAVDKITVPNNIDFASTVTLNHSLGILPKYFVIMAEIGATGIAVKNRFALIHMFGSSEHPGRVVFWGLGGTGGTSVKEDYLFEDAVFSETQIVLSNTYTGYCLLKAGVLYTLITMV